MTGPLRVAFEATSLIGPKTGVGYFAESLLAELARLDDVDVTAFPVSIRGRRALADVVPPGVAVAAPALPARVMHWLWQRGDLPRVDKLVGRPDVVYSPNFVVPPARAARVVTVHDLTMVRFPELSDAHTVTYPGLIRRAVADGALVHTDTDAVRREVVDVFDVPDTRVVTVHPGFRDMSGGDAERGRRIAGREHFVLAVGTVEPRKDLPTLVAAVDRLDRRGVEVPVVHVGPDGWGTTAFETARARMARPDLVTRLGRRDDTDLRDLYAAARVVAYPSVYEGFGLPVLEAMSAGVPVVASDDPAIVEVAAGAARLAPVGEPDDFAEEIEGLWSDDELRRRVVSAGRANLERFSWQRCAAGMVEVFRAASHA